MKAVWKAEDYNEGSAWLLLKSSNPSTITAINPVNDTGNPDDCIKIRFFRYGGYSGYDAQVTVFTYSGDARLSKSIFSQKTGGVLTGLLDPDGFDEDDDLHGWWWTDYSSYDNTDATVTIRAVLDGTNLKIWWDDNVQVCDVDISYISSIQSEGYWGAALQAGGSAGESVWFDTLYALGNVPAENVAYADYFKVTFTPIERATKNAVVAIAGGEVFVENDTGEMEGSVGIGLVMGDGSNLYMGDGSILAFGGGASSITSDRQLNMVDAFQKVYIADNNDAYVEDEGVVSGFLLTSPAVSDWTSYGIDPNSDCVLLINTSGSDVVSGTYQISKLEAGGITLNTEPGNGVTSFQVVPCVKEYDPTTKQLSKLEATTGSVPANCTVPFLFRGRLGFTGDPNYPNAVYMSRINNFQDWDYSQEDVNGAVYLPLTDAGLIGRPVVAAIPHSDDWIVFFCESQTWVLRGDPKYGGSLANLSYHIGCVSPRAVCKDGQGNVVFMSHNGLYVLSAGSDAVPQPISDHAIPDELDNIDTDLANVEIGYDATRDWIWIFITYEDARDTTHWMYDLGYGGYWPVQVYDDIDPFSTLMHQSSTAGQTGFLVGCRDGYIRRPDDAYDTDDGRIFEAYYHAGPIALSSNVYYEGRLSELIMSPSKDGNSVDYEVRVAQSEDLVQDADAVYTGELSAGRNFTIRPRARGQCALIKFATGHTARSLVMGDGTLLVMGDGEYFLRGVQTNTESRWAMERTILTTTPCGRMRNNQS